MSNKMINHAISAVLALGLTGVSTSSLADAKQDQASTIENPMLQVGNINGMEKCYGIAKAGKNDCANSGHGCNSEAKADSDKKEWVFVPTGLCKKLVDGSLQG